MKKKILREELFMQDFIGSGYNFKTKKMYRGRHPLIFFLLLIFISCNEGQQPPAEGVEQKPIRIDSQSLSSRQPAPNNYAPVDVSPMDMSYFPVDYPKLKIANEKIASPVMRLIYSRPQLQKRHLFKDLLKYKVPWRLGANEASEIQFFQPVEILEKKIKPGRYIIYCIPDTTSWTIVLNTNTDTWGLKQDESMDVGRFRIPISTGNSSLEYFTMVFTKTATGADLLIGWSDVLAKLPIRI